MGKSEQAGFTGVLLGRQNGNETTRGTTATAHPTSKLALHLKGEREGHALGWGDSIFTWDHDVSLRDDSCVYVAVCARASPQEGCPHGSLDAYYRSSAWIGWLVFWAAPEEAQVGAQGLADARPTVRDTVRSRDDS